MLVNHRQNSDPAIDKQVFKGVGLILNGVNVILMGNTSGGLDQISIGANMIRSDTNATNNLAVKSGTATSNNGHCNSINGERGANGSPGKHANCGVGGKGGIGGATCAYGGNAGNGGIGGNGGITGTGTDRGSANGGSANAGNGGSGGKGGSVFAH
jgi:hypothetical protein